MKYLIPLLAVVLVACAGSSENENNTEEKLRDEVRAYLFLDDSIKISANIIDTISVKDLDGMLATIEDNLDKVQMDIDTLNLMMDEVVYDTVQTKYELKIDVGDNTALYVDQTVSKEVLILNYQLKMSQLFTTKRAFQQSKRVMLHLKRSQQTDIAGYEILASYLAEGEEIELGFVMSAEFKIVD